MNRRTLIRLALTAALAMGAAPGALAQYALEILTLRHRTAEQVLPTLRPLLEPGATLSGQSNQLFVRTSPANLADLRLALEALDRPSRRLQVSVRFDDARASAASRIEASGSIGNRGGHVELRAQQSGGRSEERVDQRVQVLEGSRAVIYSGQSRPVRQLIQTPGGVIPQQVTVIHDQSTGFEVVPRLAGRRVHLEILPQRQSGASHLAASTTLSVELGQWIELGATASAAASAAAYRSELQGVWLKVEELP